MANQLMGMGATIPQQALRDLGIQQQVGEAERMQNQMALDLKQKQFMEEREFPTRALQEYAATVRGIPFQPSTYQTQTAYQSTPSVGQQLLQLGMGGLGAWTQFSGQPLGQTLGMTGKATGGLVGLPMVYNQAGDNEQMEFLGADRDLSIYDQMRDPEMERILVEEAQARKDAEIAEEIAREAFDIEYGIERENRKGKLDRFMDMIYTPQRLLKKYTNLRAEGGLAGLPTIYNQTANNQQNRLETNTDSEIFYHPRTGQAYQIINGMKINVLDDAGEQVMREVESFSFKRDPLRSWDDKTQTWAKGHQGFADKKAYEESILEGLNMPTHSLPENYDLSDNSQALIDAGTHYMHPTLGIMPMPPRIKDGIITGYDEEKGYPLPKTAEELLITHPDYGIPEDTPGYSIKDINIDDPDILNQMPINIQDLDQERLGQWESLPPEERTKMENLSKYDQAYGKSVAPKDVALYQQALQKHLEEGGSLDTYLATLDSMLTPEYKERKIKDIETQRALGQGLALMKAAGAAGDPNKSFIQNLVASGKAYAEDVGPSETAARTALAELEDLPLVVGEKRYTTEKDVLELTKPASAEQLSSKELQLKGKMFDKEGLLKLLEMDTSLEEGSKERELKRNQINLLGEIEKDKNLISLFSTEVGYLENQATTQASIAKTNKALIKEGIITPQEVKYGEQALLDTLFGVGKFTFDTANNIVSTDGKYIGNIEIQRIYDKYRAAISMQMARYRMFYLLQSPESIDIDSKLPIDKTLASITPILQKAKVEFGLLGNQDLQMK